MGYSLQMLCEGGDAKQVPQWQLILERLGNSFSSIWRFGRLLVSLWLRDARGRRSSIDVAFDHGASVDVADDGKSRCDRFYRNFSRLLDELESEDAFFFDARGAYGRVGRSVFDRWEQVALLDPDMFAWAPAPGEEP